MKMRTTVLLALMIFECLAFAWPLPAFSASPKVYSCPDASAAGKSMNPWTTAPANCSTPAFVTPQLGMVVGVQSAPNGASSWKVIDTAGAAEGVMTDTAEPDPAGIWSGTEQWTTAQLLAVYTPTAPVVDANACPAAPAPCVVHISWTAPTQNSDGSVLTNLQGFEIFSGVSQDGLGLLTTINNPQTLSYDVTVQPGTYWYGAKALAGTAGNFAAYVESAMSNLVTITKTAPPVLAVDCVVSAWSAWTDSTPWSACASGSQSKTQVHTRAITTAPANGGAACPVLTESQTLSQACSVAVQWVVKPNGTQPNRYAYWIVSALTGSGKMQGPYLANIAVGKPCDAAAIWAGSDWHSVSAADVVVMSPTYKGLPMMAECVKR